MTDATWAGISCQCLDRRIPAQAALRTEVTRWTHDRNAAQRTVDWRFTTAMHASNSNDSTSQVEQVRVLDPDGTHLQLRTLPSS